MCFSTACLLALGLENDSRSSPEMMSTVPPPESLSSNLLWKPSASQSTLQLVSAASSRAAVMNNSPYTLDPLSFTMDMWLTLILQLVKHTAPPLVCFSTALSNILTRAPRCGFTVVRSVPCCSWILHPGHSRGVPGSWARFLQQPQEP